MKLGALEARGSKMICAVGSEDDTRAESDSDAGAAGDDCRCDRIF